MVGGQDIGSRVLAEFVNPPVEMRPMPLWIWNGEVSRERITEMVEQFRDQGMGGVFIHARPGLVTEYLSEQWFELWAFALSECKRVGLGCHIYDENSYPSGFAGGHVMAENPLCILRFIGMRVYPPGSEIPSEGKVLAAFVVGADGKTTQAIPPDERAERNQRDPLVVLEWEQDQNRLWAAGFTQVDLALPGTTDLFLRTTHARYAERVGQDFGEAIRYAFSDEPSLATQGLHASYHFLTEFRRDHGYSLADRLEAFVTTGEESCGVRYDYYETLQRLWVTHFLRPIHDWCAAHQLEFTGHFNEHHWPNMAGQPNNMVSQRWMHVPGTDLLGFQFCPEGPAANGLYFLNLKECRSVANQLGRKRVLCETTGGGGYDMGVDAFKRLTDFAMALGVNLVNPHLSHQTLAGARKYDWPHTLSDHSPWWSCYRTQADHDARVAVALSAGKEANRVLVLQPTGSAWMYSLPNQFNTGVAGAAAAGWRQAALRSQTSLLEALYGAQIDFDLGDEWLLEELGGVENGTLRVGEGRYQCVIVPPMMETIRPATLTLLDQWVKAGGKVHFYGLGPERINGRRPGLEDRRLSDAVARWARHADSASLIAAVRAEVPPRLSAPGGRPLSSSLIWAWRGLADGSQILFLSNPWQERLEGVVEIDGGHVTNLETFTGRFCEIPAKFENGKLQLPFKLDSANHHLWWIRCQSGRPSIEIKESPRWAPELSLRSITRDEPNIYPIDYCNLELATRQLTSVNTVRADLISWQEHGFPHNPWNVSIQFKRVFLEFPFGEDSGFAASYTFFLGDLGSAMKGLEIAFERPWLYRATLNGKEFSTLGGRRWWDENVRAFAIGEWVRPGENVLRIEVRPMHPLAEVMPVYLLGDFDLVAGPVGFTAVPSRKMSVDVESWDQVGMPFYCRGVTYRYAFKTDRPARDIVINTGAWRGSAMALALDGKPLARLPHSKTIFRSPCELAPGEHELACTLFGNFKNQMGPFFCDGLPGIWSWMQHPENAPPGTSYRFIPTGLTAAPFVSLI
ncbi:MAG: glycosyl hydrolase [Candidatus Methylacidiphilales bacterium]